MFSAQISSRITKLIKLENYVVNSSIYQRLLSHGIDFFTMTNVDADKKYYFLSSHADWQRDYFHSDLYKDDKFLADYLSHRNRFYLWPIDCVTPIHEKIRECWNIKYGVSVCCYFDEEVTVAHFGSSVTNAEIKNFYINNIKYLEYLMLAFKRSLTKIEPIITNNLLSVDDFNFLDDQAVKPMCIKGRNKFTQSLDTIASASDLVDDLGMTTREIEVVHYYANGSKPGEIAKIMDISKRTVEKHLSNIKEKTQVYSQFQVGFLYGLLNEQE